MENITEHCDRCGSVVYPFSRNISVSDNSSYCIKCAEELDRHYLSKNVCSVCTMLLDKNAVKFVMPSRLYSIYFFDKLPIENRLMCVGCYRKAEKLNIIRKPLVKIEQIRLKLSSKFAKRSVVKTRSINN
jgi:hypothetical protein